MEAEDARLGVGSSESRRIPGDRSLVAMQKRR
jgi:hypothetical protein